MVGPAPQLVLLVVRPLRVRASGREEGTTFRRPTAPATDGP